MSSLVSWFKKARTLNLWIMILINCLNQRNWFCRPYLHSQMKPNYTCHRYWKRKGIRRVPKSFLHATISDNLRLCWNLTRITLETLTSRVVMSISIMWFTAGSFEYWIILARPGARCIMFRRIGSSDDAQIDWNAGINYGYIVMIAMLTIRSHRGMRMCKQWRI